MRTIKLRDMNITLNIFVDLNSSFSHNRTTSNGDQPLIVTSHEQISCFSVRGRCFPALSYAQNGGQYEPFISLFGIELGTIMHKWDKHGNASNFVTLPESYYKN